MVGQGGSFIFIPAMLQFLRLPTRVVVASNLDLVFFAALAGFVGKVSTGQVPGHLALHVALEAVPAAQLGGMLSQTTPRRWLRRMLAVVVTVAALTIGADVFR
ncbi:MAG: sulfite exporter TauE/SafE family protein [Myxococcales bacterium]|nr:sulfite exporter TauE/SafE family protein [Myxococcales bacterium]